MFVVACEGCVISKDATRLVIAIAIDFRLQECLLPGIARCYIPRFVVEMHVIPFEV